MIRKGESFFSKRSWREVDSRSFVAFIKFPNRITFRRIKARRLRKFDLVVVVDIVDVTIIIFMLVTINLFLSKTIRNVRKH